MKDVVILPKYPTENNVFLNNIGFTSEGFCTEQPHFGYNKSFMTKRIIYCLPPSPAKFEQQALG